MHALTLASALAAAHAVQAASTPTVKEPPTKRGDLPSVSASGNAFWAGDKRFYLRGIDYQPGGSSANLDPLADKSLCGRDIPKFKELGVNTIRVYSVDNSANHDECMKQLADAGIYLVLDVNNPAYSINRAKPGVSYNDVYLQSVFATIDAFAKYDNTLAFFSGNEVINDSPGSTKAAPFVKATTRDMRQYIASRKYRKIPVGYSAADVSSNRQQTADYFNCGSDDERSDFFAFNDYSWCAPSSFEKSGWDAKVKHFTDYGIPIFLSEWGCNDREARDFEELSALMSDQMSAVYSGGLMYEYSAEDNGFGIVKVESKSDKVTEKDQFKKFAAALKKYPTPTGDGGAAKESHGVKACPATDDTWDMGDWGSSSLPAMPEKARKFMKDGAGDGPGLNGDGSQSSGEDNHPTATPGSGSVGSGDDQQDGGAGALDSKVYGVAAIVGAFTAIGALLL